MPKLPFYPPEMISKTLVCCFQGNQIGAFKKSVLKWFCNKAFLYIWVLHPFLFFPTKPKIPFYLLTFLHGRCFMFALSLWKCYDLTSCSITGDKLSPIITFELLPRTSRKWSGYGKMQKNCEVNKDKISKNTKWQTDTWKFLTNKFTTLNNVSMILRLIHFSSFSSPSKQLRAQC